jgi:hypothetical protein
VSRLPLIVDDGCNQEDVGYPTGRSLARFAKVEEKYVRARTASDPDDCRRGSPKTNPAVVAKNSKVDGRRASRGLPCVINVPFLRRTALVKSDGPFSSSSSSSPLLPLPSFPATPHLRSTNLCAKHADFWNIPKFAFDTPRTQVAEVSYRIDGKQYWVGRCATADVVVIYERGGWVRILTHNVLQPNSPSLCSHGFILSSSHTSPTV